MDFFLSVQLHFTIGLFCILSLALTRWRKNGWKKCTTSSTASPRSWRSKKAGATRCAKNTGTASSTERRSHWRKTRQTKKVSMNSMWFQYDWARHPQGGGLLHAMIRAARLRRSAPSPPENFLAVFALHEPVHPLYYKYKHMFDKMYIKTGGGLLWRTR